ncbi:hypothetical protein IGI04_011819 [Brassica rapa subsp. trilocularis]|uniref:Uncharacterized protein n=1 Tax=Brassica rapa subsp. trilocularis TaxID=1813537 RepID=A0ABQ7N6L6_BRACM|nr:hypothetical protein IGI04_011819 [Brassica rapa subsp. trilocularis]
MNQKNGSRLSYFFIGESVTPEVFLHKSDFQALAVTGVGLEVRRNVSGEITITRLVPSNYNSNLESVKTEPGETDSSQRNFVFSMTSKRAYKQDILIFSQKVSSFPKEFVAHSAAVNCLKIVRKSSRVLVTGGEDHKVNLGPTPSCVYLICFVARDSVTFHASEVLVAAGAASQNNRSRKRKELDKKIKGCGGMARKICFLRLNVKGWSFFKDIDKEVYKDLADVEVKFGELEAELSETNVVNDKLQCSYNELVEYKLLLDKVLREALSAKRYSLSTTQNTVATLQLAHTKIFLSAGAIDPTKYASAIAKASLMSKCVVVDIKEPDSEASAAFRARDGGQKDLHDFQCEDEPRPALNPHIQDIQLVHLKIGDHMVVFQAIEG